MEVVFYIDKFNNDVVSYYAQKYTVVKYTGYFRWKLCRDRKLANLNYSGQYNIDVIELSFSKQLEIYHIFDPLDIESDPKDIKTFEDIVVEYTKNHLGPVTTQTELRFSIQWKLFKYIRYFARMHNYLEPFNNSWRYDQNGIWIELKNNFSIYFMEDPKRCLSFKKDDQFLAHLELKDVIYLFSTYKNVKI